MRDYEFKFGYIEFQVTPGFSNKAIQLVFGDRDLDFRRESYTGSKVSMYKWQLEQWESLIQQRILCRVRIE